jgi:Mlc titration factor MtfA (ptsG expression regulator)
VFDKVKIGPQTFKIEFRSEKSDGMLHDGNYGYTLDQGNLIVVSSDISLSKQQVTLMHEILHASRMIFEGTSIPRRKAEYDEWEHHFISIFESSFLMFIKDNPDIIEWLNS